jgi:polysaccharide export outer membrane protein
MWQVLLTAVALAAWQDAARPAVPTPVAQPAAYVVGPNDALAIKVFDEPPLSGLFRVDADGSITFPLVGRVEVAGRTVREIEARLTRLLADGFLRRPQVSVEIGEYRSRRIVVMGEVRAPGQYAIEGDVTLLEVLAKAGSLTPTAGSEVLVRRAKESAPPSAEAGPDGAGGVEVLRVSLEDLRTGKSGLDVLLRDGDTIIVEPAPRFYISGFVRSPGFYVLQPRMTVQQAIAVAGGLTERGSDRGIKIQRVEQGTSIERDARLTDLVQPNDTVKIRQRRL